jgi:sugar O-acyltransferase (sialic acid O-acetyltransferase NeuD family)
MSSTKPIEAVPPLLIFGAGGHGRVLVDAALLTRQWHQILVSDRKLPDNPAEMFLGVRLITVDAALLQNLSVHIAIGNNQFRQKEAAAWGHERLVTVVHPAAIVSVFSNLGLGCFVAAGAVIGPLARIAMGVIINHGAVVDHDVEVGAFSHVAPNASLAGHAKLGQRVLIGSGAVVLPSVLIGDDVTIGAGSVVNTDLLEPGTYAGIPARKI